VPACVVTLVTKKYVKLLRKDEARRIAVNFASTDNDLAKRKAAELAALKLVRNKVGRARWEVMLFDLDQNHSVPRTTLAGRPEGLLLFHHFR
jgi:hypothetical protein